MATEPATAAVTTAADDSNPAGTDLPGLTNPNFNGNLPVVKRTPKTSTTRRGFATASFCLGLWGSLTFWMYPFGLAVSILAVFFGSIAVALGIRAGNEGQHLAWVGIVFGSVGAGAAITIYRFYQLAFEGSLPFPLPFNWSI